MSVKHAMTVSTVPAATSSRSSSSVGIPADTTPAPRLQRPAHPVSVARTRSIQGGDHVSSEVPAANLDDRATLHRLGYAQELYRSMGGFQNFAISFTIISILAGCLTSYAIGFNQGGPVAITWGWLIVGFFCTLVAMAMGEIASTYPTAGGLYFWASKLGSP